jgi:hypothetical protein
MKTNTKKTALKIGAGVVAAAALAGAAAYLLSNTEMGKKGKAKARAWVAKAKAEIVRNVRAARSLSQADYTHLVDSAVKRYGSMQHANAAEVMQAGRELKAEWKRIRSHAEMMAKSAKRSAKKMVPKRKRVAKKRRR